MLNVSNLLTDQWNKSKAHYALNTECRTELGNELCRLLTCYMFNLTISEKNKQKNICSRHTKCLFSRHNTAWPCSLHLSGNCSSTLLQSHQWIVSGIEPLRSCCAVKLEGMCPDERKRVHQDVHTSVSTTGKGVF